MIRWLMVAWVLGCSAATCLGGGVDATADATVPANSYADDDLIFDGLSAVATDDQGHRVAVWVPLIDRCEPFVATSDDGGVLWSEAALLKTNIGFDDGLSDTQPAIATAGGTWVVVWSSTDTLEGTLDPNWDILSARSTDSGRTWSAPLSISLPISYYSEAPTIATDGRGTWIAAWDGTAIQTARSLDDGVTWETPVTIATGQSNRDPRIAVDDSGNWVLAWYSSIDFGGLSTDLDIVSTRSVDDGATWSPIRPVNTDATGPNRVDERPELAAKGDTFLAVWRAYDFNGSDFDLHYATSTNGGVTWTDPAPLNSDAADDGFGESEQDPTIAADDQGNWLAVWWAGGPGGGLLASRSTDGGVTWTDQAPLPLDTGDAFAIQPTLSVDANGNWLLTRESTSTLGGTLGGDRDLLASRLRLLFDPTCASDADADGHGTAGDGTCPFGPATDCDDTNARVAPSAVQSCDGVNNDCSHPSWPGLAATNEADDDADGLSECAGDCNDADSLSWSLPGPVSNLQIERTAGADIVLRWDAPAAPGGDPTQIVYDVLRSPAPFGCNLLGAQECVETDDGADRTATDSAQPALDETLFYQVRAENGCPAQGRLQMPSPYRIRVARRCDP